MTRASEPRAVTLEQVIQREVQDRLDRQVTLLRQPFRIAVLGLQSEGPMFVVPVSVGRGDAVEEAVRVIAASVENEMEEAYPGLRLMLRPEFAKARRASRTRRRGPSEKFARTPSRRKGR